MNYYNITNQIKLKKIILLIITLVSLVSCMESPSGTRLNRDPSSIEKRPNNTNIGAVINDDSNNSNGNQNSNGNNGIDNLTDTSSNILTGTVKLTHFVNPYTGTYEEKINIPKNYSGELYLSGPNLTTLSNQFVYVGFKFGMSDDYFAKIKATIGRGTGITPQTDKQVLILNLEDRPFEKLRLLYDLFDYNDYRDSAGNETKDLEDDPFEGTGKSNLYCRGLKLADDPTFKSSTAKTDCNASGDKCLYAYAKIGDSGLLNKSTGFLESVSKPQVSLNGSSYSPNVSYVPSICLPDRNDVANFKQVLNLSNLATLTYDATEVTIDSKDYKYKGPFRSYNYDEWEIKGSALFSSVATGTPTPTGLFQYSLNGTTESDTGYRSFLYPRSGKMKLNANIDYFGSNGPFDTKGITRLTSQGDSIWMDGCNIRVSEIDPNTQEGISSCNVTARIDVIVRDTATNKDVLVESSKDLKIQILRESLKNTAGNQVLLSALKSCSSSNACGSDECCYNDRCWSKSIVSQCIDPSTSTGFGGTGSSCSTDFDCASLCCSNGKCKVHTNQQNTIGSSSSNSNNTDDNTEDVLCAKSPGQTCVTGEFCNKRNVKKCIIIKTGTDSVTGTQLCRLQCYLVPTFGSCINAICVDAVDPVVPSFDPSNPNCTTAETPPISFETTL